MTANRTWNHVPLDPETGCWSVPLQKNLAKTLRKGVALNYFIVNCLFVITPSYRYYFVVPLLLPSCSFVELQFLSFLHILFTFPYTSLCFVLKFEKVGSESRAGAMVEKHKI